MWSQRDISFTDVFGSDVWAIRPDDQRGTTSEGMAQPRPKIAIRLRRTRPTGLKPRRDLLLRVCRSVAEFNIRKLSQVAHQSVNQLAVGGTGAFAAELA